MGLNRTIVRLVLTSAAVAFVLSIASSSGAATIPVRAGSSYGTNTDFNTCESNIVNFLNGGFASNCEGFIAGTFTIGGNTYTGDQFVFLASGGTDFGVLDVLQLSGTSLTLPLANFTLPTGVFMCGSFGNDSSVAQDSQPTNLTGLSCTSGSTSSQNGFTDSQDVSGVTMTFTLNGVTFTNGGTNPLTIFTTDGNIVGATFTPNGSGSISTPEPASLMLLGTGLATLIGFKRRKQ